MRPKPSPAERPLVFIAEFGGTLEGSPRVQDLTRRGWGRMWVARIPRPLPQEPWAFDNGAFLDYSAGRPFSRDAFLARLDRARGLDRPPILSVTPDIVAGGMESLDFSLRWLERLPRDWPWYLAVQDGMTVAAVREAAPLFAGLFLGGSTAFKETAHLWAGLARETGIAFHFGRCGTPRRLQQAYDVGADSVDSSMPLRGAHKWEAFTRAWDGLSGPRKASVSLLSLGEAR